MDRKFGILMIVLIASGAQELVAQRGGGGGGGRRDMELRIQARFDNRLREDLGLDEDQWGQLQEAMQTFRVRRREFSQSERNTRTRVEPM